MNDKGKHQVKEEKGTVRDRERERASEKKKPETAHNHTKMSFGCKID